MNNQIDARTSGMVDNIVRVLPLLYLLLLFLAAIKLFFFFNAFHINIFIFLELSEMLTLFMKDILALIALVFATFIFNTLLDEKRLDDRRTALAKEIIAEKSFLKRLSMYVRRHGEFLVIIILPVAVNLVMKLFNRAASMPILANQLIFLGFIVLMIILDEININYRNQYQRELITRQASLFLTTAGWLVMMVMVWTNIDIYAVREGKFKDVSFEWKQNRIVSDSKSYYIGQTNKYLFFYKSLTGEVEIYPLGEIERIVFKHKLAIVSETAKNQANGSTNQFPDTTPSTISTKANPTMAPTAFKK